MSATKKTSTLKEPDMAQRLKRFRSESDLSQSELARRAALSKAYISLLESGEVKNPTGGVIIRLAEALGVTIADLMGTAPTPAQPKDMPEGLAEFARRAKLGQVDLEMLMSIKYRGLPPKTSARWEFIYNAISASEGLDSIAPKKRSTGT